MRRPGGHAGLLVAAAVVLLTGCVKLDIHLQVGTDDTVTGSYVVGVQKALLAATNDDAASLYRRLTASAGSGIETAKYDDGTFVGAKFTVEAMPIADVGRLGAAAGSTATDFSLTHENGQFQFSGTVDTTTRTPPAGAEIRLTVTFPGDVVQTNGHKDGPSVTWTPPFGQRSTLSATAADHAAATASPIDRLLFTVAVLSTLALLAVVAVTLLARRQHGRRPPAL